MEQKKRSNRRPGRPRGRLQGNTLARDALLNAAEQLFAKKGFTATALREVAAKAHVNQALIAHYFGSKRGLFEAVYMRRGMQIAERRMELLHELQAARQAPTVRDLVRAYLLPQFEMKQEGPGGLAFVRMQARLHNEPEEIAFRLRRKVYDESAVQYIRALEEVLPSIDAADVNWRMVFLIGAYLYMLLGVDRLEDLSEHRFASTDDTELLDRLTSFAEGAFKAPNTYTRTKRSPRKSAGAEPNLFDKPTV